MPGAVKAPLKVSMDHAQRRVSKDRVVLFGQASREGQGGNRVSGLDLTLSSSNIWQDFTTFTAMLRPQPTREEWFTSNSGANAKLAASALTLSSGDWDELQNQQAVGPWHGKRDKSTSGTILTNASYSKNQPFSVAAFVFGRGEIYEAMRGGWNSTASISGGVGWILYSNGLVHVYKAGSYVGEGTVTLGTSAGGIDLQVIHLMLIPGRRRELMVLSITPGGGFSHVFDDIDEDDADPEITPAGKFWVQVNAGTSCVQLAPIPFATSGYVVFPVSSFAEAPALGRTVFNAAYYDESYQGGESATCSIREASSIGTVFVPNGIKTLARLRVDLVGAGNSSPFLYGATAGYESEFADTDDSEIVDVDFEAGSLKLDVPDSNSGSRFSFSVRNPEASGIAQWDILSNRPCLLSVGTCEVIDGRTKPPKDEIRPSDAAVVASWDVADLWEGLRRYQFREEVILNGADLKSTIIAVLEQGCGIDPANVDISPDPAIIISPALAPVAGEWSFIVNTGDTADRVINRLFNTYLGGWFYGFVPGLTGVKFEARPPRTVADAADIVLYLNEQDAIAALVSEGMTTAEAKLWSGQRTIKRMRRYSAAPEATEVRITGYNRERRPIQSFYRDSAAEDPTLAPSLRGENWQGERSGFGLIDPVLNDQSLTDAAAAEVGDALTRVRRIAEIETELLFHDDGRPIWRGKTVEIYGVGKYWVRAFSASSNKEPESAIATGRAAWNHRPATYLLEKQNGTTAPWGIATGARYIQDLAGRAFWQFDQITNPFRVVSSF